MKKPKIKWYEIQENRSTNGTRAIVDIVNDVVVWFEHEGDILEDICEALNLANEVGQDHGACEVSNVSHEAIKHVLEGIVELLDEGVERERIKTFVQESIDTLPPIRQPNSYAERQDNWHDD